MNLSKKAITRVSYSGLHLLCPSDPLPRAMSVSSAAASHLCSQQQRLLLGHAHDSTAAPSRLWRASLYGTGSSFFSERWRERQEECPRGSCQKTSVASKQHFKSCLPEMPLRHHYHHHHHHHHHHSLRLVPSPTPPAVASRRQLRRWTVPQLELARWQVQAAQMKGVRGMSWSAVSGASSSGSIAVEAGGGGGGGAEAVVVEEAVVGEKEAESHPPPPLSLSQVESALGSSLGRCHLVPPPCPLLIVISGPSGVGKDAVIKRLQQQVPELHFVVTATTRPARPGEVHGVDYWFVSREEFEKMVEGGELLEHALVYGDFKGIPKQQVRDALALGTDVVLRLDVQGAAFVRSIVKDRGVFIFLSAESEAALVKRLVQRKTEAVEKILLRVQTAREELTRLEEFDYVVVNSEGHLDDAVESIKSIIKAERAKVAQQRVEL